MAEYEHVVQPFAPVYDRNSRVLILGSLPSVKSREQGFYYGHPQNRFWKVLAAVLDEASPDTIEEKKAMLLRRGIAIWDVIESCDIKGSSDSSVRNARPAAVEKLLAESSIERIYANGNLAKKLYDKFLAERTGIEAEKLPSTSPANAAYSLERLIEAWRVVK